jgi:hypothetical protein
MKVNERIFLEDIISKAKKRNDPINLDLGDQNYIIKYFGNNLNDEHIKKILKNNISIVNIAGNDLIRHLILNFNEEKILLDEEINYIILNNNLKSNKSNKITSSSNKCYNEIKILSSIIENELNSDNISKLIINCNDIYDLESVLLINDLYKKLKNEKLFYFDNSKINPMELLYNTLNKIPNNKKNKIILKYVKKKKPIKKDLYVEKKYKEIIKQEKPVEKDLYVEKKDKEIIKQEKPVEKDLYVEKKDKEIIKQEKPVEQIQEPIVYSDYTKETYVDPFDDLEFINPKTSEYSYEKESEFKKFLKIIPPKVKRGIVIGVIATSCLIYGINGCFNKISDVNVEPVYNQNTQIKKIQPHSNYNPPSKSLTTNIPSNNQKPKNPYLSLIQSYNDEFRSYEASLRSNDPYQMIQNHKNNNKIIDKLRKESFPEKQELLNKAQEYDRKFQQIISRHANARKDHYTNEFLRINSIATSDNNQLNRALDMQKELERKIDYEKRMGLFSDIYIK